MPVNKCENCGLDLTLYPSLDQKTCSGCNAPLRISTPTYSQSDSATKISEDSVTIYIKKLTEICREPSLFFSKHQHEILNKSEGVSRILFFAVLVQWLAAFFNYIWKSLGIWVYGDGLFNLFHLPADLKFRSFDFFIGAGSIILSPFITVISLLINAVLIHIGTWALKIEKRDYSATLKILSYASAPWIFCIIPGVGVLIAYVYCFIIAVLGIKTVYKVSNLRALLAMLFPKFMWILLAIAAFSFIMLAALLGIGVGLFSSY